MKEMNTIRNDLEAYTEYTAHNKAFRGSKYAFILRGLDGLLIAVDSFERMMINCDAYGYELVRTLQFS